MSDKEMDTLQITLEYLRTPGIDACTAGIERFEDGLMYYDTDRLSVWQIMADLQQWDSDIEWLLFHLCHQEELPFKKDAVIALCEEFINVSDKYHGGGYVSATRKHLRQIVEGDTNKPIHTRVCDIMSELYYMIDDMYWNESFMDHMLTLPLNHILYELQNRVDDVFRVKLNS